MLMSEFNNNKYGNHKMYTIINKKKYVGLTLYNMMMAAVVRFIQSFIIKLMLSRNKNYYIANLEGKHCI